MDSMDTNGLFSHAKCAGAFLDYWLVLETNRLWKCFLTLDVMKMHFVLRWIY